MTDTLYRSRYYLTLAATYARHDALAPLAWAYQRRAEELLRHDLEPRIVIRRESSGEQSPQHR